MYQCVFQKPYSTIFEEFYILLYVLTATFIHVIQTRIAQAKDPSEAKVLACSQSYVTLNSKGAARLDCAIIGRVGVFVFKSVEIFRWHAIQIADLVFTSGTEAS